MSLKILLFSFLINLSATTDFLHCMLNTFQCYLFSKISLKDYNKIHLLDQPILYFGLYFILFETTFSNALKIITHLLSFKGTSHAYLLNKSIAHSKYLIPWLHLLSDSISAKRKPQILSLKGE